MKITPIARHQVVHLAQTALALGEIRYARRLTLAWLALYPGDLPLALLHARALLLDGLPGQAQANLETLCQADPEYLEAHQALLEARQHTGHGSVTDAAGIVFALGDKPKTGITLSAWAEPLRQTRQALTAGNIEGAARLLAPLLSLEETQPLIAVTRLRIIHLRKAPAEAQWKLAARTRQRWPANLPALLVEAEALMQSGRDDEAVERLHQAASSDITGQVAERWWGAAHPYRSLWPATLEAGSHGPSALHDIPIPARVAAVMGNNLLGVGEHTHIHSESRLQPVRAQASQISPAKSLDSNAQATLESRLQPVRAQTSQISPATSLDSNAQATPESRLQPVHAQASQSPPATSLDSGIDERVFKETKQSTYKPVNLPTCNLQPCQSVNPPTCNLQPATCQPDGRFPAYIVLSTRRGLTLQYGEAAVATIEPALQQLAASVRGGFERDALLLFADDPQSTGKLDLSAAAHNDAWGIKRLLADLDAALMQHGERIGALLIVGGPQVVPFHHLPNPVDDADPDVPSDNPYACRDENYFTPEWPVGRLPGDASRDPGTLLRGIEAITARHRQQQAAKSQNGWNKLLAWLSRWLPGRKRGGMGYTAAVWQRSSQAVYRAMRGHALGALLVSPPLAAGQVKLAQPTQLAYFNLHGLPDAAEWYGQRDPTLPGDDPHFPVALRPQDVRNGGSAPQIIFSEACYGAHILDKTVEQALALKFLAAGSRAVIGSTCTSYGSVSMPLIAADWLGRAFWSGLQAGLPAGEALRHAKLGLVQEMVKRQGYLDGEDQKTLIAFVLYGDPLALPGEQHLRRLLPAAPGPLGPIPAVNDTPGDLQPVPPALMAQVKQAVAHYLPGMQDAKTVLSRTRTTANGAKSVVAAPQVVTLRKTLAQDALHHYQVARISMGERGEVVKLVVSR
jgi:hypothetical protein